MAALPIDRSIVAKLAERQPRFGERRGFDSGGIDENFSVFDPCINGNNTTSKLLYDRVNRITKVQINNKTVIQLGLDPR